MPIQKFHHLAIICSDYAVSKRLSYPEACGLRHLAFAVDDLDAFAANLLEQGIDVEAIRVDALEDTRYTFFSDPDGLPIELRDDRLS